ncbi:MAG: sugar ABC transporter permease, partial [Mesorhizobium sp.]
MSTRDLTVPVAAPATPWRERLGTMVPILVLAPSLAASFIYVFVFTLWTLYLSLSNSSLMPTYGFVGLDNYASLWANRRWNIAYTN